MCKRSIFRSLPSIAALIVVVASLCCTFSAFGARFVPAVLEDKSKPDKIDYDDKDRPVRREHKDSDGGWTEEYKYEDPKHQDAKHPTTTIRKKFDREGEPADGGWTDTVKYDDKGFELEKTHEEQDRKGKTTGGNTEKHETRGGFKIDTFTTFDKDKKPTDRLVDKYDDKGRLRNRRHEYLDDKGNVISGTETTYIYDAEGRMTEEQRSLP